MTTIKLQALYGYPKGLQQGWFTLTLSTYHNCEHVDTVYLYSKKIGDPLMGQFFLNKVPIGIVLDYMEENFDSLLQTSEYLNKTTIIQKLRDQYKDPTRLYEQL